MKYNLKTRPKLEECDDEGEFERKNDQWFEGFENKMRLIKDSRFFEWWTQNLDGIKRRFEHHSTSGITPRELLVFFIEKEILGEAQE